MTKIVFLDTSTLGDDIKDQIDRFQNLGEVKYYEVTLPEQTNERIKDANVIVTNKVMVNAEMMKNNPQLKLIAIAATGMNNVDLAAAEEYGVEVKNAVNYSSESVAQHTFALLLALLNKINGYDNFVKDGNYTNSSVFTWIGQSYTEINGKTYGVFGMGNIGRRVAEIATAFGAKVIYYSTSGQVRDERFELVSKEDFFTKADIVSVHAPLNEKTSLAIAEKELKAMKNNALLINVGRGGIVDEKALAEAIDNNELNGAGIDVFAVEPIEKENPLLHVNNKEKIILSPHVAWASKEARKKLMEITYHNVIETLE